MRRVTATCTGPAAVAVGATSGWLPHSRSAPTGSPGWCCSSCPGPGHRRRGWWTAGSRWRRTRRTRSGPTRTCPPRPAGPRPPTLEVGGTSLGSATALAGLLDQLYARVGSAPPDPFVQETPFLDAMLLEAGCAGLTAGECHLPWQAPGGRLSRQPSYAKSDFF